MLIITVWQDIFDNTKWLYQASSLLSLSLSFIEDNLELSPLSGSLFTGDEAMCHLEGGRDAVSWVRLMAAYAARQGVWQPLWPHRGSWQPVALGKHSSTVPGSWQRESPRMLGGCPPYWSANVDR